MDFLWELHSMSYFAYVPNIVNGKGIVEQVIRITQDELNTGAWGDPFQWIQTSYNTHGGVHYGPDGQPDGGIALRANYAGIDDIYDSINDVFYDPQPYPSWLISAPTWEWQPPIPMPQNGKLYCWDESIVNWVEISSGT